MKLKNHFKFACGGKVRNVLITFYWVRLPNTALKFFENLKKEVRTWKLNEAQRAIVAF
jgi:hypothetical protein